MAQKVRQERRDRWKAWVESVWATAPRQLYQWVKRGSLGAKEAGIYTKGDEQLTGQAGLMRALAMMHGGSSGDQRCTGGTQSHGADRIMGSRKQGGSRVRASSTSPVRNQGGSSQATTAGRLPTSSCGRTRSSTGCANSSSLWKKRGNGRVRSTMPLLSCCPRAPRARA